MGEDLSPISTLSSFKVLKNLRVGMYVFFGMVIEDDTWVARDDQGNATNLASVIPASVIPASIETLYFSQAEGRVKLLTSALEEWLQVRVPYAGAAEDRFRSGSHGGR